MSNWTLQVDADRVAWLSADMAGSSANVLSGDMVRELAAKLTEIAALRPVGIIVQSGKASGFIAGADIKEFVRIRSPEEGYALVRAGQAVMQQLEDLPCPSVAAIRGFRLGGRTGIGVGMHLSHRRRRLRVVVGTAGSAARHPPGIRGYGAKRALIGVRRALELMLKGRPFRGAQALQRRAAG